MRKLFLPLSLLVLTLSNPVFSQTKIYEVVLKNNVFSPDVIVIPAGEKAQLLVKNEDSTPEEFESHELRREKIIPGNSQATIFLDALDSGEYPFFGEFHQDTAQGKIIAE